MRLLVTEVGRKTPLYSKVVKFWGAGNTRAPSSCARPSGKGIMLVSGIARDPPGNAAALSQCWIDPVTWSGRLQHPVTHSAHSALVP